MKRLIQVTLFLGTMCFFSSTTAQVAYESAVVAGGSSPAMGNVSQAYLSGPLTANPATLVFGNTSIDFVGLGFDGQYFANISGGETGPPAYSLLRGEHTAQRNFIFAPNFGANFTNGEWAISFMARVNGGGDVQYNEGIFAGSPVEFIFRQYIASASVARRFGRFAASFSWNLARNEVEVNGAEPYALNSLHPNLVSNNGKSTANGQSYSVGLYGEPLKGLSVGGSYRRRIDMGVFPEYLGYFAGGDVDIAKRLAFGIGYQRVPFAIYADFSIVRHDEIPGLANPLANALQQPLGHVDGAAFNWTDPVKTVSLGGQMHLSRSTSIMVGGQYVDQPVQKEGVFPNIFIPATAEWMITLGATRRAGRFEYTLAGMHVFKNSVTGPNLLDPAQMIEIGTEQWLFTTTVRYSLRR